MRTNNSRTIEKLHLKIRKKIGTSGFINNEDFEKSAGLFEGQNITVKKLREKAWKRI
jgi:hypothetical protein